MQDKIAINARNIVFQFQFIMVSNISILLLHCFLKLPFGFLMARIPYRWIVLKRVMIREVSSRFNNLLTHRLLQVSRHSNPVFYIFHTILSSTIR